MARYAGDAQASELGKFDATIRRMSDEDQARYASGKTDLLTEIKQFEEQESIRRSRVTKPAPKPEKIRFAGWADPRVAKLAK
jgi:hypothetical protein